MLFPLVAGLLHLELPVAEITVALLTYSAAMQGVSAWQEKAMNDLPEWIVKGREVGCRDRRRCARRAGCVLRRPLGCAASRGWAR